jgi:hypothetical protein
MRITTAILWLYRLRTRCSILRQQHSRELLALIDKQVKTTADAVAGVRDGSTVLVAGFGAVGVADNLLEALHEQGARELTIVANNSGKHGPDLLAQPHLRCPWLQR